MMSEPLATPESSKPMFFGSAGLANGTDFGPSTKLPSRTPASTPRPTKQLLRYSLSSLRAPRRKPAPPSFPRTSSCDNCTDIVKPFAAFVIWCVSEWMLRLPPGL